MTESVGNPIYERLTSGFYSLSDRQTRWITIFATLGCTVGSLPFQASMIYGPGYVPHPNAQIVTFSLAVGFALLSLPAHFVMSGLTMSHHSIQELIPLLQLTRQTPETILSGYASGILYRLKLLRLIAVVTIFSAGLSAMIMTSIQFSNVNVWHYSLVLPALVCAAVLLNRISRPCVWIGLWAALRWKRSSGAFVFTGGIACLIIMGLSADAAVSMARVTQSALIYCILIALFPFMVMLLGRYARRSSARIVGGQIDLR